MDNWSKHELLDRTSVIESNFNDFVIGQRGFKEAPKKFKKRAKKIAKQLAKLYVEASNL